MQYIYSIELVIVKIERLREHMIVSDNLGGKMQLIHCIMTYLEGVLDHNLL